MHDDPNRRIAGLPWPSLHDQLDRYGAARLPGLLTRAECEALAAGYADDLRFRSRVVMARHGFGRGEYRYYADPLPPLVGALREGLYAPLVPLANAWAGRLGEARRFPAAHADLRAECAAVGQTRPTPLLLKYVEGDYNCLHQDLYGPLVFPVQVAVLLSEPGQDFEGGEFVLTEQRPRMQSRAEVVPLRQGDAVAFAVHRRPVQGTRGTYGVALRHGVSRLRRGVRYTLGVIFHDAA